MLNDFEDGRFIVCINGNADHITVYDNEVEEFDNMTARYVPKRDIIAEYGELTMDTILNYLYKHY